MNSRSLFLDAAELVAETVFFVVSLAAALSLLWVVP
jgi:hypothetical protein